MHSESGERERDWREELERERRRALFIGYTTPCLQEHHITLWVVVQRRRRVCVGWLVRERHLTDRNSDRPRARETHLSRTTTTLDDRDGAKPPRRVAEPPERARSASRGAQRSVAFFRVQRRFRRSEGGEGLLGLV